MPATRKINREIQEDDLNQMKNLFQTNAMSAPVQEEEPVQKTPQAANVIRDDSKDISDTKIGVRLTTAKKNELKAYFISHGVTVSQGVIDAYELLRKFETEGKVAYKDGILNIL